MTTPATTALVTGAGGFVGTWLVRALAADGAEVAGLDRSPGDRDLPCPVHTLDLADRDGLAAVLADVRPTVVYHLAAQSSAGRSFDDAAGTFDANVGGTLNLLEAVRSLPEDARPRVVIAGSAEEYGPPAERTPLHEGSPLRPVSPYGVSKVAVTMLGRQACRAWGLDVVLTRPFSHTGPGHSTDFVFPSFAARIAAVERGEAPPVLKVGNLSPLRDYLHVADVVDAYRLLADRGETGRVYNICSGRPFSVQTGLDILLDATDSDIAVETDPERMRPADVPWLVGDSTRLRSRTGWRPQHDIAGALKELLAWHREKDR